MVDDRMNLAGGAIAYTAAVTGPAMLRGLADDQHRRAFLRTARTVIDWLVAN